jgi:hypothetical protein
VSTLTVAAAAPPARTSTCRSTTVSTPSATMPALAVSTWRSRSSTRTAVVVSVSTVGVTAAGSATTSTGRAPPAVVSPTSVSERAIVVPSYRPDRTRMVSPAAAVSTASASVPNGSAAVPSSLRACTASASTQWTGRPVTTVSVLVAIVVSFCNAVIVADPAVSAVAIPSAATDATAGLLDVHVTLRRASAAPVSSRAYAKYRTFWLTSAWAAVGLMP